MKYYAVKIRKISRYDDGLENPYITRERFFLLLIVFIMLILGFIGVINEIN